MNFLTRKIDDWFWKSKLADQYSEEYENLCRLPHKIRYRLAEWQCRWIGHDYQYMGPGPWDWDGEGSTYCGRCDCGDECCGMDNLDKFYEGYLETLHHFLWSIYNETLKKITGRDFAEERWQAELKVREEQREKEFQAALAIYNEKHGTNIQ